MALRIRIQLWLGGSGRAAWQTWTGPASQAPSRLCRWRMGMAPLLVPAWVPCLPSPHPPPFVLTGEHDSIMPSLQKSWKFSWKFPGDWPFAPKPLPWPLSQRHSFAVSTVLLVYDVHAYHSRVLWTCEHKSGGFIVRMAPHQPACLFLAHCSFGVNGHFTVSRTQSPRGLQADASSSCLLRLSGWSLALKRFCPSHVSCQPAGSCKGCHAG